MGGITPQAGGRTTAAMLASIAPLGAIKGSDESLANSAALQNDNDLVAPVAANATYLVRCFLDYEAGTAGNLQWQWAGPSGATMVYSYVFFPVGGGFSTAQLAGISGFSNVRTAGGNGAGSKLPVIMDGTLVTSSTPGTLQLTWSQNTSNATATIIHAQSSLALWRMS